MQVMHAAVLTPDLPQLAVLGLDRFRGENRRVEVEQEAVGDGNFHGAQLTLPVNLRFQSPSLLETRDADKRLDLSKVFLVQSE